MQASTKSFQPWPLEYIFNLRLTSNKKRLEVFLTWLGWQDSNLRMTGPKPVALPLGDSLISHYSTTGAHKLE